jgi:hypothetical protein
MTIILTKMDKHEEESRDQDWETGASGHTPVILLGRQTREGESRFEASPGQ